MKQTLCLCILMIVIVYFSSCVKPESFSDATTAVVQFRDVIYNGKSALLVLDPDATLLPKDKTLPELVLKNPPNDTTSTIRPAVVVQDDRTVINPNDRSSSNSGDTTLKMDNVMSGGATFDIGLNDRTIVGTNNETSVGTNSGTTVDMNNGTSIGMNGGATVGMNNVTTVSTNNETSVGMNDGATVGISAATSTGMNNGTSIGEATDGTNNETSVGMSGGATVSTNDVKTVDLNNGKSVDMDSEVTVKPIVNIASVNLSIKQNFDISTCSSVKQYITNSEQITPIVLSDLIPEDYNTITNERDNDDIKLAIKTLNLNRQNQVKRCREDYGYLYKTFLKFEAENKLGKGLYELKANGKGCDDFSSSVTQLYKEKLDRFTEQFDGPEFDELRDEIRTLKRDTMDKIYKKQNTCFKLQILPRNDTKTIRSRKTLESLSVDNDGIDLTRRKHTWSFIDIKSGDKEFGTQLKSKSSDKSKVFAYDNCLTLSSKDDTYDTFGMYKCEPEKNEQMFNITELTKGNSTLCHKYRNSDGIPHCFTSEGTFVPIDSITNPGEIFKWKIN